MKIGLLLFLLLGGFFFSSTDLNDPIPVSQVEEEDEKISSYVVIDTNQIDYNNFLKLTAEVQPYREKRLLGVEEFFELASEPNTIILDTRSRDDFKLAHLKGAVNLPFSEFTKRKLRKVIGTQDKRILIYCNNNFLVTRSPLPNGTNSPVNIKGENFPSIAMLSKAPALALNIPTYINLYGYGYKNVHELRGTLIVDDPRLVNKWEIDSSRLPKITELIKDGSIKQ